MSIEKWLNATKQMCLMSGKSLYGSLDSCKSWQKIGYELNIFLEPLTGAVPILHPAEAPQGGSAVLQPGPGPSLHLPEERG